jgi:hypothetical protein
MSSKMKKRWLVVGCVWALALALTFWNGVKIETVAAARGKNEQRLREIDFQRQNAKELARISKSHEALFLPVESLDLGIVAVRSRLHALAAAFDLEDVRIRTEMTQMIGDQIPCTVSMRGALGPAVGFLTALHKSLYLTIGKMTISSEKGRNKVEMQIELRFKYRIVNQPPERSVAMPQVTTVQGEQGAEAL